MNISPFDLFLLLGGLQGFILAVLLWVNTKGRRLSNRLLAGLIGLMALMSFAVGIPVANRTISLFLDLFPVFNAMLLGPLLFLYTKSLLDPEFRIGKAEKRHFFPILIDWGAPLLGWTFMLGLLLSMHTREEGIRWGHWMDQYNTYVDIPRWLSLATYWLLTRQWMNKQVARQNASHQLLHVRWLKQFLNVMLGFLLIWLLHLVPYIIPATGLTVLDQWGWYPIYIPLSVLIYWLGLKGYLHARNSPSAALLVETTPKATSTQLPADTVEAIIMRLKEAMQVDHLYLNPELTVDKVGKHIQLPAKTISFVLNQHLKKSFNTFVNEYRVAAVIKQLSNSGSEQFTIAGIAFSCGFNSQATFQRTFRQLTGMSPTEYLSRQASV
ncbi:helix-turn-helix domain-containing protein [Telluribacter humicola]|uniref:helix-turn-helix domain-containing protein n=1 Tax=Telluribacter humicola TaxID=1720261 RepID=UPI001A960F23|nr:helix-turn-helix transcriptional regulator [Telluribacter humicola]